MRQRIVSIQLRVKEAHGYQPYYPAIVNANGIVKPFYCRIGGNPVLREDGMYYLRHRDRSGKRHHQYVGTDPKLARTMQLQRQHFMDGEDMGLSIAEPPSIPRPPKVRMAAPPSVAALAHQDAPQPELPSERHPIVQTVDKFVKEMTVIRSLDCGADYRFKLGIFVSFTTKTYLDQIDDDEIIAYVAELKTRELASRTVKNYCSSLNAFLRRYGYKDKIKKRLLPKPTKKIVAAYSPEDLKAIFDGATKEEEMLFRFFLGLGMREQEVMYAAWPDIQSDRGLFKVTEKLDVGFKIKDKEERLIPIPSDLLERLKKRFETKKHRRWIFPTDRGQPDGHMLRRLQKLALREGLNCGMCLTKKGASCLDHACCKRFGLHKFRRTFATLHHDNGVPIRTLMEWLGHSDLQTTIRYLATSDPASQKTRKLVDKTWDCLLS